MGVVSRSPFLISYSRSLTSLPLNRYFSNTLSLSSCLIHSFSSCENLYSRPDFLHMLDRLMALTLARVTGSS